MNRYLNIAVTWFGLGVIAGVIVAIPAGCQPEPGWHITQGGHQ